MKRLGKRVVGNLHVKYGSVVWREGTAARRADWDTKDDGRLAWRICTTEGTFPLPFGRELDATHVAKRMHELIGSDSAEDMMIRTEQLGGKQELKKRLFEDLQW